MSYRLRRSLRHFAMASFFAFLFPLVALALMQGVYHAARQTDIALAESSGNTDQQQVEKPQVQKAGYKPASGAPRRLTDLAGTDEQAWASIPKRYRHRTRH